jgi:hypothetical protein
MRKKCTKPHLKVSILISVLQYVYFDFSSTIKVVLAESLMPS